MCQQLNKDAVKEREAALEEECAKAAAEIIRSRVKVVASVEEVKDHMERNSKDGIRARCLWLDWTQSSALQTSGTWTKSLAAQPSKKVQEEVCASILKLPYTPITGGVVIRQGPMLFLNDFLSGLNKHMTCGRSLFVPIDVPAHYDRIQKSAARRALGPTVDLKEISGVELTMRMLGAGAEPQAGKNEDEDNDDEEEEMMLEDDPTDVPPQGESSLGVECMSECQMKHRFGRHALHVFGAMFQHASKIGEQARFLEVNDITMMSTNSGSKRVYRKGQLHETVILSAVKSQLATTACGIGAQDAFVQYFGGTPEGVVGGILAGFPHLFYIGTEREVSWMTLPTRAEEHMNNIKYLEYVSPNADCPEQGILAVSAVRRLSKFILNGVLENPNTIMIPPPSTISIPPLRTYTFIPVTGRVIARTIMPDTSKPSEGKETGKANEKGKETGKANQKQESAQEKEDPAKEKPVPKGKGSASGKEKVVPKAGSNTHVVTDSENDEAETDHIEYDDDDMDEDLAKLDKLENEEKNKSKAKPKQGAKRKAEA